ncbi:MAG: hypothetical protein HUU10_00020 [Bacteroidetes bacterium]|nr:hypothetical protein [Bacteroidota bacterium]
MKKYGELVLEEGFATEEQIRTALEYQKTSDTLLGKVLVDMGIITLEQQYDLNHLHKLPDNQGKRIGELAVLNGFATESDIERALAFQKKVKGFLGDIMIELGYITAKQHEIILAMQRD